MSTTIDDLSGVRNRTPAFSDDWRKPPHPRPCQHCRASVTTCEAKSLLSGRRCCAKCSNGAHPVRETGVS